VAQKPDRLRALAPSPFPASPVPIGSLVAGKYRVDGVLGRGGMGVVVAATDLGLERKVAIKFVERQDEHAAARFLREARAAARVDSEHVTRVFEVGVEQRAPFIVMERLQGQDLAALIAAGPVPGPVAAGYGLQICEALAQAHAARIVHRDLKPENLFLHTRSDGRRMIKVLDFGISKNLEGTVLTQSQTIVGTPQYLAPEQIEHPERVDERTDIWALGVVLYELSSGERPFRGGSMAELCMNILGGQPAPLGSKVRGLPAGLERAVHRCLSKPMEERFANVAELARELATASDPDSALLLSTIERATERVVQAANGGTATPTPDAAVLAHIDSSLAGSALAATPVADTERSAFGQRPAGTASRRGSGALAAAATLALGAAVWWNARRERETRSESIAAVTTAPAPAAAAGPSSTPGASAPAVTHAPVVSVAPVPVPSSATPAAGSAPAPTAASAAASAKPAERAPRVRSTTPAPGAAAPPPATPAASIPATSPPQAANAPSKAPPSAGAASCRVLEVIANGRKVEPAAGRVTFEWARRSCSQHAQPGGEPYDLSDAGMSVKCVCD
jgi:eukaryotic-like serine/threonine-protein kinase